VLRATFRAVAAAAALFGASADATAVDRIVEPGDPVPGVAIDSERLTATGIAGKKAARVLWRRIPDLRSCYEHRLQESPNLTGQMRLKIAISASGQVSDATLVSSTMRDEILEKCVIDGLRRFEFDRPAREGATVQFSAYFCWVPEHEHTLNDVIYKWKHKPRACKDDGLEARLGIPICCTPRSPEDMR
jgi:hypothetical protein